jgi:type VI secretion system secreted protein Hcp
MPISGFINWGDIKGGSTDDKHKDWSEITGFSHGMSQPASATRSTSGGGYESTAVQDPFSITMRQDSAPPNLYGAVFGSQRFKISIVFANSSLGVKGPHHKLEIRDAWITSINPGVKSSSGHGATGYVKVTFRASEYYFNGLRNLPIPHAWVHLGGV